MVMVKKCFCDDKNEISLLSNIKSKNQNEKPLCALRINAVLHLIKKSITTKLQLGLYPSDPPCTTFSNTHSRSLSSKLSTSPSIGVGIKVEGSSRS